MTARRLVVAMGVGALFSIGLGLSGLTNPAKVIGFLDVTGWDPTLAFVMAGALLAHAPMVRIARGRPRPRWADRFDWPTRHALDVRLIAGAAVFGVGWGLAGLCPGPALVGLGSLFPRILVFVVMLAVGTEIGRAIVTQKK